MPSRPQQDEYDRVVPVTGRVGAHRGQRTAGQRLVPWLWIVLGAALGSVILILALVIGLNNLLVPSVAGSTPATAQATVEPTLDPSATVAILDGTTTPDLGDVAQQALTADGWNVTEVSNADRDDIARTQVVYTDPSLEGAAKGIAKDVGTTEVVLDQTNYAVLGTGLVLILGSDYSPAAG